MRVELDHLTKRFGGTTAVDDVSVNFASGELTALLGPSGCGKSTLLYMLAGIAPVTAGTIRFGGDDVTSLPPDKRGVGLVFQNYALYPHMTVLDNIAFPLTVQKMPRAERRAAAEEMARLVHVDELLARKPAQLSGGQQQRVAIARALVKRPRLLLLDEPLSNLDARLRLEMRDEVRRIQRETGVTTVFVTHDQDEALAIADSVLLMRAGSIQQLGAPQELYDDPATAFVAQFLGSPPINHLDGVVAAGRFVLADGSASCSLPAGVHVADGQQVTLAIRAESIVAAATVADVPVGGGQRVAEHPAEHVAEPLVAELVRSHSMGRERNTFVRFGSAELHTFVDPALADGTALRLTLLPTGVFVFDAAGVRVR